MRKYLVLLLTGLICLAVNLAPAAVPIQGASEPTGLTSVTLWVYPEYDDPRLLVMLEGKIVGVNAPATIRFLVPTAAEMFSAGSIDSTGKYSGGPPARQTSTVAGWDEISYTLTTNTFRIEYYDPIIPSITDKTFAYDFRAVYPVSNLNVIIQVPTKASAFKVVPSGTKTTEGTFTVYSSNFTSVPTDAPLHFDLSYTKTDPNPSIGQSSTSGSTTSGSGSSNLTPILIGAVVVVIAILGIWYVTSTKKRAPARRKASSQGNSKTTQGRSKFCSQCGKPLEYPSKFCPYCRNKIE